MQEYNAILLKEIFAVSFVGILLLIASIIIIIFIIKDGLGKWLYLVSAIGILAVLLASIYIFNCAMDIKYSSYIEYDGDCVSKGKDTVVLKDANKTKLNSTYRHLTNDNNKKIIVYSARSKIIVDIKLKE